MEGGEEEILQLLQKRGKVKDNLLYQKGGEWGGGVL